MTLLLQCPLRGSFAVLESWTDSFGEENNQDANQEISIDALVGLCDMVSDFQKD